MSNVAYLEEGDIRFYFNDFSKHNYELLTLEELVKKISAESTVRYKFDAQGMELLNRIPKTEVMGFCSNRYGDTLIFNQAGEIVTTEEMLKQQMLDAHISYFDIANGLYKIPEGLYLKVIPTNDLVQLVEILETVAIHKY